MVLELALSLLGGGKKKSPKEEALDKQREAQKRAWKEARANASKKQSYYIDPVTGNFIVNGSVLKTDSGSGSGGSGSSGMDSDGGYSDGDYSDGTGESEQEELKSSMTESERKYIENMKDSNVPYYYEKDENDLMYLAASEQ